MAHLGNFHLSFVTGGKAGHRLWDERGLMRLLTLLLTLEIAMAQQLCRPQQGTVYQWPHLARTAHSSFRFQEE